MGAVIIGAFGYFNPPMPKTEDEALADGTATEEENKNIVELREALSEEDLHSTSVIAKLKGIGISERTAVVAKKELGVSSYRKEGMWFWHYDQQSAAKRQTDAES